MIDDEKEIREALEALASGVSTDDHPEVADLLRLRQGELGDEEERRLLDHISQCRECSALALAAPEFAQAEEQWQGSKGRRFRLVTARWLPLAAVLFVGFGLGFLVASMGIDRIANLPDVVAQGSGMAEPRVWLMPLHADVERSVEVLAPEPGRLVVLLLDPPFALPPGTELILERRYKDHFETIRSAPAELNRLGTYSLPVEENVLGAGHYRIRLLDAAGRALEGVFEFEIRSRR